MRSRTGRREFIRSCGALGCVLIGNRIALFQSVHASRDPVAIWRFDQRAGARTLESARGLLDVVSNRGNSPEWTCGASGSALRFDGYSTWLSHPASLAPRLTNALTLEVWVAVDSYPVSDAAFVNQQSYPSAGYFFGLNKYGFWGLGLSVRDSLPWHECWAPEPLPKGEWLHVAATFDRSAGVSLYLNGKEIRSQKLPTAPLTPAEDVDLWIGKHNHTPLLDETFATGMFSGIIDELKIYDLALDAAEISDHFRSARILCPPDLAVPSGRFQDDAHRPQYHLLPPAAWTNEPHGLIFWKGEYHLFYQKNPTGPYWGQIQWGHMASRDLVHWTHLPVALVPEPGVDQQGCWSGSSTINRGVPTIVYTGGDGEKATICIATSQDDMRSWKKYSGNPIIASPPAELHAKEFRDPFVWNEGEVFYMIIGSGIADVGGTALLYKSQDMIHWQFLKPLLVGNKKDSGVFWEMPVFGRVGDKHILMVTEVPARDSYWIGTWKNETFIPDSVTPRRLELVNHYLSPSIRPDQQGRLVAIGIIPETRHRSELFAAGWAHVFGLPRVLSLTPDGQLKQKPLPELAMLRESHRRFEDVLVSSDAANVLHGLQGDSLEIVAEFTERKALRFGLKLRCSPDAQEETTIFYDSFDQSLNIDRIRSSINPAVERDVRGGKFEFGPEESLTLHVFLDHSVVEVFVNGRATFTSRIYPTRHDSRGVDVFAEGGVVRLKSLDVWSIKSIWT
jgi:sucrose-6-phosphate hydrolase SacC (GH32 family)